MQAHHRRDTVAMNIRTVFSDQTNYAKTNEKAFTVLFTLLCSDTGSTTYCADCVLPENQGHPTESFGKKT